MDILMKPASGMCNMRCDYCFYCDETQKRSTESFGFMSEETLKNIIRKTIPHADRMITYAYQGGEPMLRGINFYKKAISLQKQYNKKKVHVNNALQTNGSLIDEEWCEFFKEHHFLIGISIDGVKKTHDLSRHSKTGLPTYERIEQSARLLEQYGVEYNVLTVVNEKVAEHIEEIYQSYREHGWTYQQYIACLDPLGEGHGKIKYALKPEQYGGFLIRLFDLWYGDWKKGEQPYIRTFENYISILLGRTPESCAQRGSCGIQTVVEADGSVYPCDFYMLDEYCIGNFNKDRWPDIEQKREEIRFVARSRNLSEQCKKCSYYFICRGGCQRNRDYDRTSGFYKNYFCESYRMFFEYSLDRMREVAQTLLQAI